MICPLCKSDSLVTDSRPTDEANMWRRRRQCTMCKHRWTTIEMPVAQAKAAVRIVKAVQHVLATPET